ncbi:MAG: sulfatase [Planctomycetota bacterium]
MGRVKRDGGSMNADPEEACSPTDFALFRMRSSLSLLLLLCLLPRLFADDPPNIVFMLADDQSWGGTSVAMHPDFEFSRSRIVQTPSLEKLAAQGMRFSSAYAPAPVCSPTRCSLQLGISPAQTGWTKAAPVMEASNGYRLIPPQVGKSLSKGTTTIAELLRNAGYATAHYGKWHLNGSGPSEHGYDDSDGATSNEYAYRFQDPNPVDIFGMADRAARFMKKNSEIGKPFYIQLSWHALHAPENALKSTIAKYQRLTNGRGASGVAIAEDLDTGVGRVMEAIDRLGLADRTYVIYMSDNGGGGRSSQLRGGKGSVYEGGIRSPLIVRGPGVLANSWCHTPVVGYDFFPTFCQWAGMKVSRLPRGIEGGSLASILANGGSGDVIRPRPELVFHFPHYQSTDGPQTAMIFGQMKLMKFYDSDRVALFDLSTDIQERNDLATQRPEETQQLHDRLQSYLASVGAKIPQLNPEFDPKNQPSLIQRGPPQGGKEKSRKRESSRQRRKLGKPKRDRND